MGAKAIVVTSLAQPTGLAGAPVAGGTLAANTTYYYTVIAMIPRPLTGGRSVMAESVPSDEIAVSTDGSRRTISLTWDAVVGAERYLVLRTTTSGSYDHVAEEHAVGRSTTRELDYLDHVTNAFVDTGANAVFPYRINPLGTPMVSVDGGDATNRITEDDIYDAMVAAGCEAWCGRWGTLLGTYLSYRFFAGLYIGYSDATYIRWGRKKVFLFEGSFRCGSFTDQECGSLAAAGYGYHGSTFLFAGRAITATAHRIDGVFRFYGCNFLDANGAYSENTPYSGYGGYKANSLLCSWSGSDLLNRSRLVDCWVDGNSGNNTFSGAIDVERGNLYAAIRQEGTTAPVFTGSNVLYASRLYTYGGPYARFDGLVVVSVGTLYSFHGSSALKYTTFVDVTPSNQSAYIGTNPERTKFIWRYRLDLRVLGLDGAPIPGATVAMWDGTGSNYAMFVDSSARMASDLSTATTSLVVTDGSLFAAGDVLLIMEELMQVTQVVGDTLKLTRNLDGVDLIGRTHNYQMGYPIYKWHPSLTTDAGGRIPQLEMRHSRVGYAGSVVTTTYSPYTVTVSAPGYQTKTISLTMDRKREQVVTLEPAVPLLLPMGEAVYRNLAPADGQNKTKWLRL